MANWTGTLLTKAGQILQAKVETGVVLDITKMKFGDGQESLNEALELTDLKSPKYEAELESKKYEGSVCTVSSLLKAADIEEGFYIREMGLFANDPDVGEILFAVAVDDFPDYAPSKKQNITTRARYRMSFSITNVAEIKLEIIETTSVNKEELAEAAGLLERAKTYEAGAIVRNPQLPSNWVLQCVEPGTTAEADQNLMRKTVGDTYKDGTATWLIAMPLTTGEDRFIKDESGNLKVNRVVHPYEPVKFVIKPNGNVAPIGIEFYSNKFTYNKDGNLTLKGENGEGGEIETPTTPDESKVASNDDIDAMFNS